MRSRVLTGLRNFVTDTDLHVLQASTSAMLSHLGSDPTGYTVLAQIIGQDMAQFQRRWETEMLKLRP
jgi:hypothetical protein